MSQFVVHNDPEPISNLHYFRQIQCQPLKFKETLTLSMQLIQNIINTINWIDFNFFFNATEVGDPDTFLFNCNRND